MKAIHIFKYGRFPLLKEMSIPELGQADLLIKMKYAPVNPSDLFFYQGKYGILKEGFPVVGFEGSGVVIKSRDPKFIGRKVSVSANMSNGTHATHILSSIREVIFWPEEADLQQISMSFINPFSCVGLCNIIKKEKPENVLISAAASQIGKMMISKLHKDFPSLNIVALNRSTNKSDILENLGLNKLILIDESMEQNISELKNKTVFLDCLSGQVAGKAFNQLGPNSKMVCYGRQSGENLSDVDVGSLYYKNKQIQGFWLNNWLKEISKEEANQTAQEIISSFDLYKSTIRKVFKIEEFMDAYRLSIQDKSEGKVLLDLS